MALPKGPRNAHIQQTYGADTNLMKFYVTSNSTAYGSHWDKFKPRTGRHTGTGYQANFRPQVYYQKRLDDLDNPAMGNIVAGNYESVTTRHFRPYSTPSGKETLPFTAKNNGSGFVREKPVTIPTEQQVLSVHADTRLGPSANDYGPRAQPLLHKLQRKDPVEQENHGYGPGAMTSEYGVRFAGEQPARADLNYKSVGPKEVQGNVHNQNIEPITYMPGDPHKGDKPGWMTMRPTGSSIYTKDYNPYATPTGAEKLPAVASRSEHESGSTRDKPKPAYAERGPVDYTSFNTASYQGKQRPDLSEADRLGRRAVGFKEESGFSHNKDPYIWSPDDPRRFVTHYQTRFYDKTEQGADRAGNTWGQVHPALPDGFTKSTAVHAAPQQPSSTAVLRTLEPYVARSIKARDRFFDDHTHDRAIHA